MLADRQVAVDEDTWRDQCKGMAEYRLGHYEEAIKWLIKGTKGDTWCRAQSELFLGMAYFKVGREQEARATLDHAVWLLDNELPRRGETYTDTKLTDSVLCKYARAEAEALLGPAPATRPATTRSVAN